MGAQGRGQEVRSWNALAGMEFGALWRYVLVLYSLAMERHEV